VDTLHLSARGQLKTHVREALETAKARAQEAEEQVPIEFPLTSQAFLVRPYGLRGYSYWLSSPDFELILGKGERFPAALLQFHSAYLHSCGPVIAHDLVDLMLRHELFVGPPEVAVSRIDLYVDFQGWTPQLNDMGRFVCQGRRRRVFEEAYATGRRLTGFMFGQGGIAARVYDKTEECRKRSNQWVVEIWKDVDPAQPVWRLEFQFRRSVLAEFHLKAVGETLESIQDLWGYGTGRWLSLRKPTGEKQVKHWPEASVWSQLRSAVLAPTSTGIVRQRIDEASEERVVRGLMGFVTSLAALRGHHEAGEAFADAQPLVLRYLAARDRDFVGEVRRKQSRLLSVTAPVPDPEVAPWRVREWPQQ
jgi:hypothetical protein